jgi:ubiquinone/menaquinone biosynthesis C-methylase UbiE
MRAKAYKGLGMEGVTATWYAAITRKDMSEFTAVARRMSLGLAAGTSVLEVAPGPGYFAIELARLVGYEVTGLDISASFVRIARLNAAEAGVVVDFRHGDAAAMPFAADRFDFVFCRAAFKNFAQPVAALTEMRRVLKTGGRAVIIDLRADVSNEEIDAYVDKMGLGATNRVMTRRILRWLRKRAYTEDDFRRFIAASDFHSAKISTSTTGFEISLVK